MARSVLIVEDDQDLSLSLALNLRAEGYRTLVASDAIAALSTARRERPDLIVLDLGLPGGGGLDVLGRIRRLHDIAHTPVIVLTARDESFRAPALAAGAQAFFRKPADDGALMAAIGEQLGAQVGTDLDRGEALEYLRELFSALS